MNSMNYKRLEKSLTDVIQEAQLKIGYDHHPFTPEDYAAFGF